MIKPENLKIGNFVRVSRDYCIFPKGRLCEVIGIDAKLSFKEEKGAANLIPLDIEVRGTPHLVWCDSIEGIPFNVAFLVKNGWEDVEYHRSLKERFECVVFKRPDTCVEIQYYRPQDEYAAFFHGEKLCGITCIHELQNILASIKEDIKITI